MLRRFVSILGSLFVGCAAHPSSPPNAPVDALNRGVILVPRVVVTEGSARSLDELFAEAQMLEAAGRFQDAAPKFRRVFELEPRGRLAMQALFHAASAADEAGLLEASLKDYDEFYRSFPEHELSLAALVRTARLLIHLEKWARAGEVADVLLARLDTLADLARVAAYSAKALALIAVADDEHAAYFVEKGRQVLEALNLDAAGKLPSDAAPLYFALGEVRRLRADRIRFNPVPKEFGQVLEQRCQLLLDAQSAYSNSMRAYDAHWSAMAGFRVGELYHALHSDLMLVPAPAGATDVGKQRLFEGAMRLRYSVLLKKALSMMEHTVSMADRTGETSEWVNRARASRVALEEDVKKEQAAIDQLGFSRSDLQAALDRLTQKASGSH